MGSIVGIDIADFQPDQVPGDWLFVVLKITEGEHVSNEKAGAQWAFASRFPHRGVYHYAVVPAGAGEAAICEAGAKQAEFFATVALGMGFRKDVDMWQLDAEAELNALVTPQEWAWFVPFFMNRCAALLGKVGFQYGPAFYGAGYYWYPSYGNNDGQDFGVPPGIPAVIHQYTSAGGLDQNHIANPTTWANLTKPLNWAAIVKYWLWVAAMKQLAALIGSVTKRPAKYLDRGGNVKAIQGLLVKHHYAVKVDGVYGSSTVFAVHAFKAQHGWKDPDGHYCGRRCLLALLKP